MTTELTGINKLVPDGKWRLVQRATGQISLTNVGNLDARGGKTRVWTSDAADDATAQAELAALAASLPPVLTYAQQVIAKFETFPPVIQGKFAALLQFASAAGMNPAQVKAGIEAIPPASDAEAQAKAELLAIPAS